MPRKSTQLRNILKSKELDFLMEAHNGLSAKIVEEAKFRGIWASGLSISASLGVRDNNEASWTQILEVLEFMSDATSIPILLDGDTGYGNFNNARRLIRKLEQRQIAGVCIEDKLFPKTNSFISGESQPLADIGEFSGKIKAMKDTQEDHDFVVVARIEAFIAGWGISEAIRRAEAYQEAGADAILIHSKLSNCSEIELFMKEWGNRIPVIIVPTKYYSTPTDVFRELGVNLVIWANHNLRSSITAMQKITRQIFIEKSLKNVEDDIASVNEIFRIQNARELEENEKKYLPCNSSTSKAFILAASQGNLGSITKNEPKTLIKVKGETILSSQVTKLKKVGINQITVIRGFKKNKIKIPSLTFVDNDEYKDTDELYSLFCAKDGLEGNIVVSYGDIIYRSYILNDLINDSNDITLIADADFNPRDANRDFIKTDRKYSKMLLGTAVKLQKISNNLPLTEISGEFIGLFKANSTGTNIIKQTIDELSQNSDFSKMTLIDLFNEIIKKHPIAVKFIKGSWLDIDTVSDLQKANNS